MPEVGDGEVLRFNFWINGSTPDTDGNGDNYLEDYYQLSFMDLQALAWHASANAPGATEGSAYWCADEELGANGGYLDEWMQYLDTPSIAITDGATLTAKLRWGIESPAGAVVAGSCTDGWDAANVRISIDGGSTWALLEDPNMPYDFDCGYGWIYNDGEYDTGGSLNQVAAGWGGTNPVGFGQPQDSYSDFSVDLSSYAGENVIVRFAFGSDPAFSVFDDSGMTGFQVDNITIESADGVLYGDDCDSSVNANTMIPSGEVWESMFYDYCDETRPGGNGWEQYVPGLAFNGNALHDISHLAGKDVIVKFTSRYDGDDDGGSGEGIYIDDFVIYKEAGLAGPGDLMAEAGNGEVSLTWQDMNASGTNEDFIWDNDAFAAGNLISMVDADAVGYAGSSFEFWSASGLAGVWAEENTRESIYAALKRKETFATSGPRIRVRLFASYNFSPGDEENTEVIDKAYSSGTPMGSEIKARNLSPYFLAMASADPLSQPLQRLQVIKGYLKNGVPVDKIYDIACPGNNQPDLKTYRCPSNGAKVNLSDSEISKKLSKIFDLTPYGIEKRLKLRNPIYSETAAYGHMGRKPLKINKTFDSPYSGRVTKQVELFTWEKLDYVKIIKEKFKL